MRGKSEAKRETNAQYNAKPVSSKVERTTITSGKRIPVLDGLRGLAILMILIYHSVDFIPTTVGQHIALGFRSGLWSGVDLFFVLSGFLITGILLDTKEDPNFFKTFYARRTLRIFPLYYGFLAAVLLLPWIISFVIDIPMLNKAMQSEGYHKLQTGQAWLWSYTQNFALAKGPHTFPGMGHLWSLAVEEQFYLVWPLCVWFLRQRQLFIATSFAVVGIAALRIGLLATGWETWPIMHNTFTRVDTLLYGALAAMVVRSPEMLKRIRCR